MAAAEAQRILQSVIDFRSSIHSERLLDTCPKTLSALVALENAINDEFEVVVGRQGAQIRGEFV